MERYFKLKIPLQKKLIISIDESNRVLQISILFILIFVPWRLMIGRVIEDEAVFVASKYG